MSRFSKNTHSETLFAQQGGICVSGCEDLTRLSSPNACFRLRGFDALYFLMLWFCCYPSISVVFGLVSSAIAFRTFSASWGNFTLVYSCCCCRHKYLSRIDTCLLTHYFVHNYPCSHPCSHLITLPSISMRHRIDYVLTKFG